MALRNFIGTLSVALVLFCLASCTNGNERAEVAPDNEEISATGTVRFVQVEGGCWVIRTDNGRSLSPFRLPPAFMQDGLRVSLRARPMPDMISKCMTGMIVEIISIERLPATPAK